MSGIEYQRIAWDSCVFLAWFQDEKDKPLGEIREILQDISDEKIVLIVSAIVAAEVLDRAGESKAGTQFRGYVRRPNIVRANLDFRAAERAAKIRERAVEAIKSKKLLLGVKAPDAIVVATALLHRVDVLHTFDKVLLELDGSPIVEGLRITKPTSLSGQRPLDFRD
jgi:predicted nucleic acid-binding protein